MHTKFGLIVQTVKELLLIINKKSKTPPKRGFVLVEMRGFEPRSCSFRLISPTCLGQHLANVPKFHNSLIL
jgi:hypothetical protein